MKLTNRTILITGGTSGLGLGMAKTFAARGNKVIVAGRNEKRLNEILAENPEFSGYTADVADLNSLENLKTQIEKDFPNLDVLVNSAGIMRHYNLFDENVTPSNLTDEIQTNLIGTITATKLFIPILEKNAGTVINISSGLANMSDGAHPVYDATKTAVRFFTESLRGQAEYFGKNLEVIEVVPPLVGETNLEDTISADAPNSLSMTDFLAETFAGFEAGLDRIDIGHAKNYWKLANENRDEFTKQTTENLMKVYFPKN